VTRRVATLAWRVGCEHGDPVTRRVRLTAHVLDRAAKRLGLGERAVLRLVGLAVAHGPLRRRGAAWEAWSGPGRWLVTQAPDGTWVAVTVVPRRGWRP
jgi:enamine deaminase RidA (YjgF/YER057c/UK114 family)